LVAHGSALPQHYLRGRFIAGDSVRTGIAQLETGCSTGKAGIACAYRGPLTFFHDQAMKEAAS